MQFQSFTVLASYSVKDTALVGLDLNRDGI